MFFRTLVQVTGSSFEFRGAYFFYSVCILLWCNQLCSNTHVLNVLQQHVSHTQHSLANCLDDCMMGCVSVTGHVPLTQTFPWRHMKPHLYVTWNLTKKREVTSLPSWLMWAAIINPESSSSSHLCCNILFWQHQQMLTHRQSAESHHNCHKSEHELSWRQMAADSLFEMEL